VTAIVAAIAGSIVTVIGGVILARRSRRVAALLELAQGSVIDGALRDIRPIASHPSRARAASESPRWTTLIATMRLAGILRNDDVGGPIQDVKLDLMDYHNDWQGGQASEKGDREETVLKAENALRRARSLALDKLAPQGTIRYRFEQRLPRRVRRWLDRKQK